MMEYWIVYDIATGEERYRGSGTTGMAAVQPLTDGLALVVVPQAVVSAQPLDLTALRGMATVGVDQQAEATRMSFLTPGAGQAITYTRKEAEARAWTVDNATPTPFLCAEATARGMTLADVAAEVVAMADAWVTIGSMIEALRMGAKAAIASAETLGSIVAASKVDWSQLHG